MARLCVCFFRDSLEARPRGARPLSITLPPSLLLFPFRPIKRQVKPSIWSIHKCTLPSLCEHLHAVATQCLPLPRDTPTTRLHPIISLIPTGCTSLETCVEGLHRRSNVRNQRSEIRALVVALFLHRFETPLAYEKTASAASQTNPVKRSPIFLSAGDPR